MNVSTEAHYMLEGTIMVINLENFGDVENFGDAPVFMRYGSQPG